MIRGRPVGEMKGRRRGQRIALLSGGHESERLRSSGVRCAVASVALALTFAAPASAQTPADPSAQEQARSAWKEGAAAFAKGDYEAARVAFDQAYNLTHEPKTLQSLGEAELRSGHVVEAARHLSQFLRAIGSDTQRDLATRSLSKAVAQVVQVDVQVNETDADISVDDESIGRSPVGEPQFVKPGVVHVVKARKDALAAAETFEAKAGEKRKVTLALVASTDATLATPPVSSGADATSHEPSTLPTVAASAHPTDDVSNAPNGRTLVLIGGATLSGVALGIGAVFGIKAIHDGQNADAYRSALPFATKENPCNPASSADAANCAKLSDTADTESTDKTIAAGALVTGAIFGVATIATALLWPRHPKSTTGGAASVVPYGPMGAGGKVVISF